MTTYLGVNQLNARLRLVEDALYDAHLQIARGDASASVRPHIQCACVFCASYRNQRAKDEASSA